MGPEKGMPIIDEMEGVAALMIRKVKLRMNQVRLVKSG